MNKIFVFGSINMDLVFELDRMPKPGETIKSNKFFMSPGGKGANQALAVAKQGIETYMIGSVGADSLSKASLESLSFNNVICDYISEVKGKHGGIAGIIIENGDNRIITDAGANALADANSAINALTEKSSYKDILIAQLEIPQQTIKKAFDKAKFLGVITILNAAPAGNLDEGLIQLTDILVVNETETEVLTGVSIASDEDIIKAASMLIDKGTKAVLLTLGENGSVYVDKKIFYKQEAYKVPAIDTTAAGDTYIGAFASQLLIEKTIPEAMKYASAAAAIAIQKYGAQISIPDKNAVEKFLVEKERQ